MFKYQHTRWYRRVYGIVMYTNVSVKRNSQNALERMSLKSNSSKLIDITLHYNWYYITLQLVFHSITVGIILD